MKIYFEDGVLISSLQLPFEYEHKIDAVYGYSSNKKALDYLLEFNPDAVIYTNSVVALDNKYVWNKESKTPEIYIRAGEHMVYMRIDKLTSRELRESHNLMKLYMNNEFGNL